MRRARVVAINLLVLLALLALLETGLRLAGLKPLFWPDTRSNRASVLYGRICRQFRTGKIIRENGKFFTDGDGIFRAMTPPGAGDGGTVINSSGFRGNEFAPLRTQRTSVFFIGDSFTWGASAMPVTESFPDRVERSGYHVWNGGMPGTDPQQYALLAEKYVPRLKPDVTAICLYLGNDLKNHTVPLLPYRNLYYDTGGGFIRGYDDRGRYFADANQALDYLKKQKCGCTRGLFEAFLYKTVVGKAVYGFFHMGSRLRPDPERKWVVECLERIDRVCQASGSRFLLFLIPNKTAKRNDRNLRLVDSFPAVVYHYPRNFVCADYCLDPDNHFNNQGHGKFADFILNVLKAEGYPPHP